MLRRWTCAAEFANRYLIRKSTSSVGSICSGRRLPTEVKRFIYIGTAGAGYGEPKQMPVPEDYPMNPITPYGISKHTVEHYLFTFQFLYGMDYVVFRYGNVYGPRQSSQGEAGVFAIFSEQMLAGIQPTIYGDGTKIRDYVYISDVVAANVAALDRGTKEIFNISSGVQTTDQEVFNLVRSLLGKSVQPKYAPRRPGEIDRICLDISKAERLLGWKPPSFTCGRCAPHRRLFPAAG